MRACLCLCTFLWVFDWFWAGHSFRALASGTDTGFPWRQSFFYHYPVRGNSQKRGWSTHCGVSTKDLKLFYIYGNLRDNSHKPVFELYDLQADPLEMQNIYTSPSEDRVCQMHELLAEALTIARDTCGGQKQKILDVSAQCAALSTS